MFFDEQYPVNIAGAKAVFYPANSLSLGDNILWTMITGHYFKANPDEDISLLPFNTDIMTLANTSRIDKLFVRQPSCLTDAQILKLRQVTSVYLYELHVECHELWKRGEYPVFALQSAQEMADIPSLIGWRQFDKGMAGRYVVFHIRNIKTIKSKNTDPALVQKIMQRLLDRLSGVAIVLLGNDDSYGRDVEYLDCDRVIDLRRKLTLEEIYQVIQSCQLFIGSDSGIVHLAGCCDVPMVCWNFVDEYWFPKVRNLDRCLFLTKEESRVEVILREVGVRSCGVME